MRDDSEQPLEASGQHSGMSPVGPAGEAAPPGPVTLRERLDSMDLIRGVAIFGILMVNMAFFSVPFAHAIYPATYESWPPADQWTHLIVKVFFEYKFVSTFSVLFGAGLTMQYLRARSRGAAFGWLHYRRMALLAVFGLVHASLLWYGDILFIYACVGSVFFFFRALKPRTMLIVAAALLAASAVIATGLTAVNVLTVAAKAEQRAAQVEGGSTSPAEAGADEAPAGTNEPASGIAAEPPPRGFEAMMDAQFDFFADSWVAAEEAAYRDGPFAEAMLFRSVSYGFTLVFTLFGFAWHVLAMFLIGGALMKIGFFAPDKRALQRRVAMVGLIVGGILECGHGALLSLSPATIDGPDIAGAPVHALGAPLLCLGYVGALAWLASTGGGRLLHAPFRAVGRMALSAYLLTTLTVTFIMYHWGLGLFGAVSRFDQAMIGLAVYAGLVVFCSVWLSLVRYGPFEWLWRAVTYARSPG